jgi:hypothetical protein
LLPNPLLFNTETGKVLLFHILIKYIVRPFWLSETIFFSSSPNDLFEIIQLEVWPSSGSGITYKATINFRGKSLGVIGHWRLIV